MQPVNETTHNSSQRNDEEITPNNNLPGAGTVLSLEHSIDPAETENLDNAMKESELPATTHMHFKDEEPVMPSGESLEEDDKNKHEEILFD